MVEFATIVSVGQIKPAGQSHRLPFWPPRGQSPASRCLASWLPAASPNTPSLQTLTQTHFGTDYAAHVVKQVDGEKDPRCLMAAFTLVEQMVISGFAIEGCVESDWAPRALLSNCAPTCSVMMMHNVRLCVILGPLSLFWFRGWSPTRDFQACGGPVRHHLVLLSHHVHPAAKRQVR